MFLHESTWIHGFMFSKYNSKCWTFNVVCPAASLWPSGSYNPSLCHVFMSESKNTLEIVIITQEIWTKLQRNTLWLLENKTQTHAWTFLWVCLTFRGRLVRKCVGFIHEQKHLDEGDEKISYPPVGLQKLLLSLSLLAPNQLLYCPLLVLPGVDCRILKYQVLLWFNYIYGLFFMSGRKRHNPLYLS